jgi:hypothetical protein
MREQKERVRDSVQWDSILFFVAGSFMLVNVTFLWIRVHSDFTLSIIWAAIPGIIAFTASIIGLFKLYPRISSKTPWLARSGAGFALTAGTALGIAAIWILFMAIFAGGISEPPPNGILALIGIFILSMVIAFVCNAVAFLMDSSTRNMGYLLIIPVASWALMLSIGIIKGMETGLSLDLYTNGIIAVAFLLIGHLLRKDHDYPVSDNQSQT